MKHLKTSSECFIYRKKCVGSIGLVPTMGALHEGHLSLIKKSLSLCNTTIVTIFVNPKQFSEKEDLDTYPVCLERDLALLKDLDVPCVFTPSLSEIYSDNHSFDVVENKLSLLLEGLSRPRFFSGVITMVSKLFNLFQPTHTFFGEKDAQQLTIIKKMIKDLNYNINCIALPTVRAKNGLALSSRNQYLSKKQKDVASNIYRALLLVKECVNSDERNVKIVSDVFCNHLNKYTELRLDYFSISDLETLEDVCPIITNNVLISAAVYLGSVRLIDNVVCSI